MSKRDPFKYFKTSPEIIKLAVMYYVRYPLSLRQVEDILHERGIDICHETSCQIKMRFEPISDILQLMSKRDPFKYFKTSPEIIKLAVMYYVRYPLSLRQVEDILHERGIDICHETVRYWWNKFGTLFTKDLKKKSSYSHSNWRWHIDEVFVKINGETHYLWRAIDHEGTVLDCYVTKRRNKKAALKVLKKLMSQHGRPKEIVTDKLPSYKAALKDMGAANLQSTERYKNNQVENSHLHFRRRERGMNKFRSMRSLQKFISIQSTFQNHFTHQRHLETRQTFKNLRQNSVDTWKTVCA